MIFKEKSLYFLLYFNTYCVQLFEIFSFQLPLLLKWEKMCFECNQSHLIISYTLCFVWIIKNEFTKIYRLADWGDIESNIYCILEYMSNYNYFNLLLYFY